MPKERSDRGAFRRLDEDTARAIRDMHGKYPKMPMSVVYDNLIASGVIAREDVSLSTVQRFARREFREGAGGGEGKERRAFEAEVVNGIWQADTLYGPFADADGSRRRAYLQTIVDDKSRMIVGSRFTLSDDLASFQALLKGAVTTYGVPARLYVDNGGAYANKQLATICAQIGTVPSHAPVRDGAAKGKIERLNRTVRMKLLSQMPEDAALPLDELNGRLAAWVVEYNSTVHSVTGEKPVDVWARAAPGVRRVDPGSADELFRCRVARTVNKDATVRLDKVSYDVPAGHEGEKALVLFTPGGTGDVWVCLEGGEPERVWPTDKVANARRRRDGARMRVDYSAEGGEA